MNRRTLVLLLSCLAVIGNVFVASAQDRIVYYESDFEDGIPSEITTYDVDSQKLHYTMIQAGFKQGDAWIGKREKKGENRYAASACRYKEMEDQTLSPANDWLVLPLVWVRSDDAILRWNAMSVNSTLDIGAGYEVRISTQGPDPNDFSTTILYSTQEESINEWSQHEVSLGEFVGQRVNIAFVNNSATGEIIGVDDIVIEGAKGICDIVVTSDRYIYGKNELTIKGVIEACSNEEVTDITIRCDSGGQEIELSKSGLSLKHGDSYEFELPTTLHVDYGLTIDYQVVAEINKSVVTDAVMCQSTALMERFHRNIVVEEATGMWCSYCPSGIVAMEELEKRYPDSFIGLALHYNDQLGVDDYVEGLTFSDGFPTGWINRKHYTSPMMPVEGEEGKYTTLNGGFETYFLEEIALPAVAGVDVKIEPNNDIYQVSTDLRFAMDLADANYRVAYVVVENDVVGDGYYQVNGYSGKDVEMGGFEDLPVEIFDIKFQHVVRKIYDDWQGIDGSVPSQIVGGETYTHKYELALPTTISNIENVVVVAMLIDMQTGEIVNADTVDISTTIDALEADDVVMISTICDGRVKVSFTGEDICDGCVMLCDMHGQIIENKRIDDLFVEFDSECQKGVYIVVYRQDNCLQTQKIIVK